MEEADTGVWGMIVGLILTLIGLAMLAAIFSLPVVLIYVAYELFTAYRRMASDHVGEN